MVEVLTWTEDAAIRLREYLNSHVISSGIGTEESACSVAAINLALTGVLTDKIPSCMSWVIGYWIVEMQDHMPSHLRNSDAWKNALMLTPSTGQDDDDEQRRIDILTHHLWAVALPLAQPIADAWDFGDKWRLLIRERSRESALEAERVLRRTRDQPCVKNLFYAASSLVALSGNRSSSMCMAAAAANCAIAVRGWDALDLPGLLARLCRVGGKNVE